MMANTRRPNRVIMQNPQVAAAGTDADVTSDPATGEPDYTGKGEQLCCLGSWAVFVYGQTDRQEDMRQALC